MFLVRFLKILVAFNRSCLNASHFEKKNFWEKILFLFKKIKLLRNRYVPNQELFLGGHIVFVLFVGLSLKLCILACHHMIFIPLRKFQQQNLMHSSANQGKNIFSKLSLNIYFQKTVIIFRCVNKM